MHLDCAAIPLILFCGHLVGGASTPIAASVMTGAVSLAAVSTLLGSRSRLSRTYLKRLLWPAIPFIALLVLAFFSVWPGSAALRQGLIDSRLNIRTLSIDPAATWVEVLKFGGLAAVFLAGRPAGVDRVRLKATVTAMLVLGVVWALWALLLFVGHWSQAGLHRLALPFVSPNVAAANLGVTILCGIALLPGGVQAPRDRAGNVLLIGIAGLVLLSCLVLTASRSTIAIIGGTGALALAAKGMTAATGPDRRTFRLVLTVVAICVAAVSLYAMTDLAPRFARLGTDAVDRWSIFKIYGDAARQSPWFGYGFGSVPRLSRLLLTPQNDAAFWNIRAVHNLPIQWWVESGLIGLVLGSLSLASILGVSVRHLSSKSLKRLLPLLLISFLFLTQGLVDYAAQIYSMSLTWAFVLGLIFSASTADRRRRESTSKRASTDAGVVPSVSAASASRPYPLVSISDPPRRHR